MQYMTSMRAYYPTTKRGLMTFKEELPDQCPPADAADTQMDKVCRFLFFPNGDPRNFQSHRQLGKNTGSATECRARSVSFFTHDAVPSVVDARKTAFFKDKPICLLDIPSGSGLSLQTKGHIDFWMYNGYTPDDSVIAVVETVAELLELTKDG